ncbi:tagatose-6-phosphate kinase [Fictibacillus terranigra]|uniref:Tagatose-6-phosphate kinase n=1 Tax=Fictibacillus terranigra TaxID=3058424 RepID=A0ABT8E563_9BACL|nr:tagatose-6-phosphate kinase [Fictibacillus sp. CENA-BCM004]MDN4073024.1 tagatose-6-phosphate kinase [Fictibacillus sp. CENA-BCM004]
MILAVTMNPSVDISYPIQDLKLDHVNRVENVYKTAGGKGLNVARIVKQMGEDVMATGVLGGTIGDFIIQELKKSDIGNNFFKINQESRNCIAILHDGKQTEILESGPTLSAEEGAAFLEKYRELLFEITLVTISGSLPKGLESGFYQMMVEIGQEKGIPVIVDTSGKSLKQVLNHKVKPFAIKPNIAELSQLFGIEVERSNSSLKRVLINEMFDGIEWVVVSLGESGAFVKHGGDYYRVTIPAIDVVNPVGSGDATVAGLAVALKRKQSVSDVLKTAMTTGLLNTIEAGTGYIDIAKFGPFFELVEIKKID